MTASPTLGDLLTAREHFAAMWATATTDTRDGYRARIEHCDQLIDQAIGYPARPAGTEQRNLGTTATIPSPDKPR